MGLRGTTERTYALPPSARGGIVTAGEDGNYQRDREIAWLAGGGAEQPQRGPAQHDGVEGVRDGGFGA
jgi:hypothetical protein